MTYIGLVVPTSPLVNPDFTLRPEWRRFFTNLLLRTGGNQGTDIGTLQAELDAEEAARAAGDQALAFDISAEQDARIAGDNANSQAITAEANARYWADYTEQQARIAGDAALVPKAQLCSLWAACDLSFLPTADPGHGMPWLNGNAINVGTGPAAMVGIGLEDGTGDWELPDGTGHWLWG